MKKCTKCKTDKPLTEFYQNKNRKGGLSSWCKECDSDRNENYRKSHKQEHRDYMREYQIQYILDNPEKQMLSSTKTRAKELNIPFNLEESDIIIPEICPILKVPLVRGTRHAPSIDRIIPELGYVKGNIQVISHKANAMKNDATPTELKKFAEWIETIH